MSGKDSLSRERLISKVEIGTAIHVNSESGSFKYRANLVGYNHGMLLTSLPSEKQLDLKDVNYPVLFAQGTSTVMRLIIDGVIYAFKSEIQDIHQRASKILVSQLPETIQMRRLREGVRYPCVLQANFLLGETKYRGVLTNISEGGCLLSMKSGSYTEAIKTEMKNDKSTSLDVRFPFEEKDCTFDVKVKSVGGTSDSNLLIGISFISEEKELDVIRKYLDFMQLEELSEYLLLS